jgi:Cu-processing system permease protein
MLWFYFSLIYDGLLLFFLFQFSDYPLEKAMIVLSSLNPIDLGRILILLKLDIAALMGYTGAVFDEVLWRKKTGGISETRQPDFPDPFVETTFAAGTSLR